MQDDRSLQERLQRLHEVLGRTETAAEVDALLTQYRFNTRILRRRVDGIADPVRLRQARELMGQLLAVDPEGPQDVFGLRKEILAANESLDGLMARNRALSEYLSELVAGLIAE